MPIIEWSDNYITVCDIEKVQIRLDWKKEKIAEIAILDDDGNEKEEAPDEKSEELPPFHYPCNVPAYREYKAPLDSLTEEAITGAAADIETTVSGMEQNDTPLNKLKGRLLEYVRLNQPVYLPVTSLTKNSTLYEEREKLFDFLDTRSKLEIQTAIKVLLSEGELKRTRHGSSYPYEYSLQIAQSQTDDNRQEVEVLVEASKEKVASKTGGKRAEKERIIKQRQDEIKVKLMEYVKLNQPVILPVHVLETSSEYPLKMKLFDFIGSDSSYEVYAALSTLVRDGKLIRSREEVGGFYKYSLQPFPDQVSNNGRCPRCNRTLEKLDACNELACGENFTFEHCFNCGQDFYPPIQSVKEIGDLIEDIKDDLTEDEIED